MSPELMFWFALATKPAITALFVSVATIMAERLGAAVGALVATLPHSIFSDTATPAGGSTGDRPPPATRAARELIEQVRAAFPTMTEEEVIRALELWGGLS